MSRSVLRRRLIAIIAACAMVTVICGFTAHGFAAHDQQSDHCDWTMHFTGLAGSAPQPAPIARPALATWQRPAICPIAAPSPRRVRSHLPRGPPVQLLPANAVA